LKLESAVSFHLRIIVGLIGIITLIVLTFLGSIGYITPSDAQNIYNDLNNTLQNISPFGIFKNNFSISVMMIIPFIGAILAAIIAYNTGQAFAAISIVRFGSNMGGKLFLLTMLFPHFWLEYISYGFATAQSIIFLYVLIKAIKNKKYDILLTEFFITLLIVGIVAGLLLTGAIIEYSLISHQ